MRSATVLLSLASALIVPCVAHASPITYTLIGTGSFAGDRVTYTTTDGFLSFSRITYTGQSTGTLDFFRTPISGFGFLASDTYEFVDSYGDSEQNLTTAYSLTALNETQTLNDATLTITDATIASTPEPSSFVLLATGALGLVGVARRRLHTK